ncbi:hypothetical protein [Muriicola sp.]|uniref:hypothetical protein n=1 Tax=Muriicola sp. TaxID=2020856 RepID=UPI0035656082
MVSKGLDGHEYAMDVVLKYRIIPQEHNQALRFKSGLWTGRDPKAGLSYAS